MGEHKLAAQEVLQGVIKADSVRPVQKRREQRRAVGDELIPRKSLSITPVIMWLQNMMPRPEYRRAASRVPGCSAPSSGAVGLRGLRGLRGLGSPKYPV